MSKEINKKLDEILENQILLYSTMIQEANIPTAKSKLDKLRGTFLEQEERRLSGKPQVNKIHFGKPR